MADLPNKASDKTPNPSDEKFTIKVKGQEKEVSREEVIKLAQMGDDYSQNVVDLKKREETLKSSEKADAEIRAVINEMKTDPKLAESLNKAYTDFKSGKSFKSKEAKEEGLKTLDKLVEKTDDPDQRENLRSLRTIIKEETGDFGTVLSELKKVRDEMSLLKNASLTTREENVTAGIAKLKEDFGNEVVEKYETDIKTMALRYPNQSVKQLFQYFAKDDDLEKVFLSRSEKRKTEELNRKREGAFPGGPGIAPGKIDIPRDEKTGRVNISDFVKKIVDKAQGKA